MLPNPVRLGSCVIPILFALPALADEAPSARACGEQISVLRSRYTTDFLPARSRGLGLRSRTTVTQQVALREAKSLIEGNAELMAALRAYGREVIPFREHGPEETARALTSAIARRVRTALNDDRISRQLANYSEEDLPGTSAKRGLYRGSDGTLSLIRDRIRVTPGVAGVVMVTVSTTIRVGDGDATVEAERVMQIFAGPESVLVGYDGNETRFAELQVDGYDPRIASEAEFIDRYLAAGCPRPAAVISPPAGAPRGGAPSARD